MTAPFLSAVELTRDNENQVHSDTNTDNGDRVYQTSAQEEGHLQFGGQFRLAGRALDELATQQTNAYRGTQTTQSHHEGGSNVD
tara:strand:+ start:180 stop:431 length:252 start_codon:yes stop_codon:yes gene_type:complete